MRATEGTFRALMTQDRQFRVPLYQRHYKWKTDQQEDLWLDILEQYQALQSGADIPPHFIGSIVAVERATDPLHDFRHFRVVDGQQRLTTLSLAIAALRDVAAEDDPEQYERLSKKYLINDTEPKKSETWARFVPGEEDAAAYWTVLTDPANVSGHTPIGNAYKFFREKVTSLRDLGELQTEALATTIGDRLALVFVTVVEKERPHKIFESINATGVSLSQSDLLRNYLFMALGERSNAVYRESWRPLEQSLGGDGLEGLVRDDLQSSGTFIKKGNVYRAARARLEQNASDLDYLEEEVRRLARRGRYYSLFLQPTDPTNSATALGLSKKALRHLTFLRGWGATTTYPLLLKIFSEFDSGGATAEQVDSCLEAIESFLVRRYLVDYKTNILNRLFLSTAASLPNEDLPINDALRRELSRDGRWPSDELVRQGIATVPYYRNGRALQRKLVLQRIESHLRAEIDLDFDSAQLSIEHVMPQTLSQAWKQELIEEGQDPQAAFERYGHTLGNLTLTAWNSQLSNKLFERKQEILQNSDLKLNELLAKSSKWGVEEIQDRAEALAVAAALIWSPPVPGVMTAQTGFDWNIVDEAVAAIPTGSWTSYGDLAEMAGTAAQPTANHVGRDPSLTFAYRVLNGDGSLSPSFKWTNPSDNRDPMEVLIGEGIEFDAQDRASQAQRLGPAELQAILDGEDGP